MELTKFLSLCGMLFGFIAVVFLSRGLLLSADQILRGTFNYSPMEWPSLAIISDKAFQKADTLSSMILAFLALALQLCSVFANSNTHFTSGWEKAVIIAILVVTIVTIAVHYVDSVKKKSYEMEIKKLAARDYVKSAVEEMGVPLLSGLQAIAGEYFLFKKQAEEKDLDFVKRFSAFLEYKLPENVDLTKFR